VKAIVLLSDGIDSPLAYHIMKKDMECIALHFFMDGKEKIEEIMSILHGKIYLIPYEIIKKEVLKVKESYRCIICKRLMYRIAEKVAMKEGASIIVTGENIGQVASQTLDNLNAIEESISIPVVRPLIALDKEEIINAAKEIGTYEISIRQRRRCPIAPKKPVTRARIERVKEEERKINMDAVSMAIQSATIRHFK